MITCSRSWVHEIPNAVTLYAAGSDVDNKKKYDIKYTNIQEADHANECRLVAHRNGKWKAKVHSFTLVTKDERIRDCSYVKPNGESLSNPMPVVSAAHCGHTYMSCDQPCAGT